MEIAAPYSISGNTIRRNEKGNTMKLTPALKGQLTKALKGDNTNSFAGKIPVIASIFAKHMPREQAKHAARNYLAAVA